MCSTDSPLLTAKLIGDLGLFVLRDSTNTDALVDALVSSLLRLLVPGFQRILSFRKHTNITKHTTRWLDNQRCSWRHGRAPSPVRPELFSQTHWYTHWTCEHKHNYQNSSHWLTLINGSVKTRLQVQVKSQKITEVTPPHDEHHHHYDSTMDAIKKIIAHEGIEGLYSGIHGALVGVASTNFAYFYWYSIVRTLYMKSNLPHPPNTAIELSLGAIAGAVAQVFTIPVAVVTTRQQTQKKGEKKSFIETGKEVVHSEDGWSGLWRGLKASLVLVVNPAITYGAYQRLRDVIFPGKTNLRPWEAFGGYIRLVCTCILANTCCSSGCIVQITCYNCDSAIDCCEGRPAISSATIKTRETIQNIQRSHGLYH